MAEEANYYQVRWQNFKAFEDTGWLTIKPLTVLIGPNNSGKSSVISPLLLFSQTMSSRDAQTPIVTRGPLIDTGSFRDIIHGHDLSKAISLQFRFHIFTDQPEKKDLVPPGATAITLRAGDDAEGISLQEFELSDLYNRPLLKKSRRATGGYETSGPLLAKLRLSPQELNVIKSTKPVNFMFSPAAVLNAVRRSKVKLDPDNFSKGFQAYLVSLGISFEEFRYVTRNLSYVGPLRDRPRRFYETSAELPVSVGPRGEHMANILRRKYDELKPELDQWIEKFEFGKYLHVKKLPSDIFSVSFETRRPRTSTNIASAGFGASQVLPLIVQALTARRNSLTIAEQPEIHLNPRLQCLLADLFVTMATSRRRVIIETHSEHLLLRLRRLIGLGKIKNSDVALYFVEKKNGASTIREIPIEPSGYIASESWPRGFFEEGLREAIALAATAHSRTKKASAKRKSSKA
jgi:predicted ATPase